MLWYEDVTDHRSYTNNVGSGEIKAWKNPGQNGIRTHDLCNPVQCTTNWAIKPSGGHNTFRPECFFRLYCLSYMYNYDGQSCIYDLSYIHLHFSPSQMAWSLAQMVKHCTSITEVFESRSGLNFFIIYHNFLSCVCNCEDQSCLSPHVSVQSSNSWYFLFILMLVFP